MTENVGSISYDAGIDTKQLKLDAAKADAIARDTGDSIATETEKGTSRASAALASLAKVAKLAFVAVGAAATTGLGISIKSAAEFESSLSQLRQASGATASEMAQLSSVARQLGKDNALVGVTASDVAQTMLELSKAGLDVNDTLAASKGVLALARAGQIEFADAAVIAASALNAFGLRGADATKVADALAAGANASQANLSDLALGLQQSATVAKQFNLSLDSTVTALALFANNGIKGSDAGTSLKTMLISLASPSTKAAKAMKQINFEAYDAQGNFVGLREVSIRLQKSLQGLTEEQKNAALATIFGTDAFRAASVLANNAGDSYDAMNKSVNESGAAFKAADAQLGPFSKAMEGFKNEVSDVGLQIGTAVLPTLTKLAKSLESNVGPAFEKTKDFAKNAYDVFKQVADYLGPKLGAVGNSAKQLFTEFSNLAKAVGPAVGAGLVWALGMAIDILNVFLSVVTPVIGFLADNTWVVWGLVAAFVAFKGAILIDGAIKAFQAGMALAVASSVATTGAMAGATTGAGLLRGALLKLAGPWQIALAIVGVEAVLFAISQIKGAMDKVNKAFDELNEKKVTVGGGKDGPKVSGSSDLGIIQQIKNAFSGRASGGPVSANTPYVVGENSNGSLNKTSELFVPRSSGNIVNSSDLQEALSGGKSSSGSTEITIGTINISKEVDGERWIQKLTQRQEIVSGGLVPTQAYGSI